MPKIAPTGTRSTFWMSRITTCPLALSPSGRVVPGGACIPMVTGYETLPTSCSKSAPNTVPLVVLPKAAMSVMVPTIVCPARASVSTSAWSPTCRNSTSTSSTEPRISTDAGSAMTTASWSSLTSSLSLTCTSPTMPLKVAMSSPCASGILASSNARCAVASSARLSSISASVGDCRSDSSLRAFARSSCLASMSRRIVFFSEVFGSATRRSSVSASARSLRASA